ncbi:hypothetical protein EJB05_52044, partial [Eragrostis curvula]
MEAVESIVQELAATVQEPPSRYLIPEHERLGGKQLVGAERPEPVPAGIELRGGSRQAWFVRESRESKPWTTGRGAGDVDLFLGVWSGGIRSIVSCASARLTKPLVTER